MKNLSLVLIILASFTAFDALARTEVDDDFSTVMAEDDSIRSDVTLQPATEAQADAPSIEGNNGNASPEISEEVTKFQNEKTDDNDGMVLKKVPKSHHKRHLKTSNRHSKSSRIASKRTHKNNLHKRHLKKTLVVHKTKKNKKHRAA